MSDIKYTNSYPLNRSEYGIYMNEKAFPNSAINTIGFMLRFPSHDAKTLTLACDKVIDALDFFGCTYDEEERGPVIKWSEKRPSHTVTFDTPLSVWESNDKWERIAAEPMKKTMYEFTVYPLMQGGSVLMARFHHMILDGYDMCKIVKVLLSALEKNEVEHIPYSHPEDKVIDDSEERNFWLDYFYDADNEPKIMQETTDSIKRTRLRIPFGQGFSRLLIRFSEKFSLKPSYIFSAALALYIARATNKKEAVFIMPRLGRKTKEELLEYGCHTQAVPVRIQIDENMNFVDLCRLAYERAKTASAHKKHGIGNILGDLKNAGLLAEGLSEYTLNIYNSMMLSTIPYDIDMSMSGAMHNHLTLNITSFQGSYEMHYDMRDGIYDAKRTLRLHNSLYNIIQEGIQNTDRPVGEFNILSQAEFELLSQQEGKTLPLAERSNIPSLFREAVKKYADRPALFAGNKSFTFRELDIVSNRVANALLALGVEPAQPVMYKLRRDEKPVPVMLGILKAGAAFIPIDPAYPLGRIEYIQKNSGSSLMIVNDPSKEESEGIKILSADELLNFEDSSDPELSIPTDQLAYCIYTSGTTGNPKGAMLSHRGIVNIVHPDNNPVNREITQVGKGICAIGSVCFDISLFEFFVPMMNGMYIVFASEPAMTDPELLAELIIKYDANMIHCTPSRLTAYLGNDKFVKALERIRVILVAGERVPRSLVNELRDRYGIHIYNGYGPTETTIGATITEAGDNSTIGKPIANTGIMILDRKGRLLPYGAVGEIYIYGTGLGLGYKNLPEETKNSFVTHYGIPMYKTGDLGSFAEDGRIIYHGRNDFQVKIRGLRIELPEIENYIRTFEGVTNACAQVRKIGLSDHIAAFYTVKEGAEVDETALKNYVTQRLPLYMVPEIFKRLDEIPSTPGGKVDLAALKKIPVEIKKIYRKPENRVQEAICKAFEQTLNVNRVSITDSFYDLGGDSLHTAELVHNIEKLLKGVDIAYEDIFRYPTPEMLAKCLYLRQTEKNRSHPNPLEKLDYTKVNKALETKLSGDIKTKKLGNVLLTGATGFLGIHILSALLKEPDSWDRIYCLIRPTSRQTPEKRLKTTLFYFEESDCSEFYGTRLFAVSGDITERFLFTENFDDKIDTVINCAASVRHFAHDDTLERINVDGVSNLIRFCKKQGAALCQVSTISVGGVYDVKSEPLCLKEDRLFVGQEIKNQYIMSKFEAEYNILNAAADIPVKIMRVGNLQGRISDGEFQMNRKSNAFTRQITSYVKLGMISESVYKSSVNFSPVDEVARMITALASIDTDCAVFHVYPPEEVGYDRLAEGLSSLGIKLDIVSDDEFSDRVDELSESENGRKMLEGLFVERPDLRYQWTAVDDSFTKDVIQKMGLEWKEISDKYLRRYFRALDELGTFDI